MKTATVRDLRNRYTTLLAWLGAGEEILITQRGTTVARLVPEQDAKRGRVDWSKSEAVKRDRSKERMLSAKASAAILTAAAGQW